MGHWRNVGHAKQGVIRTPAEKSAGDTPEARDSKTVTMPNLDGAFRNLTARRNLGWLTQRSQRFTKEFLRALGVLRGGIICRDRSTDFYFTP